MAEVGFDGRRRVIVESVSPSVDDGRFPAKRVAGDLVLAEADIFADGHDVLAGVLWWRHRGEAAWQETRAVAMANDRWRAEFRVEKLGFYEFAFEGWVDHFQTWYRDLQKRVESDQSDLDVQLLIGLEMIGAAAARATGRDRHRLDHFIALLDGKGEIMDKVLQIE